MNPELRFKHLWLAIGCLLIVYVFYSSLRPDPIELDIDDFDKYAHTFAYFVLMGWFTQIYQQKKRVLILAVGFVLMGILIEILQGFSGYRQFDYYDMLANSSGVLLGWLLSMTPLKNTLSYFDQKLAG